MLSDTLQERLEKSNYGILLLNIEFIDRRLPKYHNSWTYEYCKSTYLLIYTSAVKGTVLTQLKAELNDGYGTQ